MLRTLIYPSSGACDYSVELPHWSYCSWFDVCWSFGWSGIRVAGWNSDTTPTQPHQNSNTHLTKNNTANVVIQQNSHKLLMMDILISETCWAHKKWNKIASDIKLVFYSSSTNLYLLCSDVVNYFLSSKYCNLLISCFYVIIYIKIIYVNSSNITTSLVTKIAIHSYTFFTSWLHYDYFNIHMDFVIL